MLERRRFIRMGAIAAAALIIPGAAMADEWVSGVPPEDFPQIPDRTARLLAPRRRYGRAASVRELSFYNVHTGESLQTAYFEDGHYVPGALHEVNYLFRDFR